MLRLFSLAQGVQDYAGEDAQHASYNEHGGEYSATYGQVAFSSSYVNYSDADDKTNHQQDTT